MAIHTDPMDVYGVSGGEIYAEWQKLGGDCTLADYLRNQYNELGRLNPGGGWDAESAPDFGAMAREIERQNA